jgi:pimeloyl-ACP methyl ester carboxylesterase
VLLIHGWPDSAHLWRHQVRFLTGRGFRAIAPDMRGCGRSSRPPEVADYALANAVGDVAGVLDTLGIRAAHVVGHDWAAAVAWLTATFIPDRVNKLAVLSVGHPRAPRTLRQDEMAWYQLFFQFEGIAEATLQYQDGAWLRGSAVATGPGTLPARPVPARRAHRVAELVPGQPGTPDAGDRTRASSGAGPTLGIWSTNNHYLDGERMRSQARTSRRRGVTR